MKAGSWLLVFSMTLLGCAGDAPSVPTAGVEPMSDMYRRGDGREKIQCRSVGEPNICGSLGFGPESVYSDCSDEQFNCLFSTSDVLAVPKVGLSLGEKYSVFGANLAVERCFGDQASCEIAVISSRCADVEICSCRSDMPSRTTTFYYSRDKGITAFITTADAAHIGVDADALADALPLMTYVLVSEKGFLSAPLVLRRAPLRAGCPN